MTSDLSWPLMEDPMLLRVKRRYVCRGRIIEPGAIEVSDDEGAWLLRDCPDNFVQVVVETRAFDAPPQDKMVRKARVKHG